MIAIELESDVRRLVDRIDDAPERMLRAIAGALDLENELTVGHIQATKLSRRGRNTLGVVNNRLRSSVRPSRARIAGDKVVSSIGSNVRYAGVHEFGFSGRVTVKAHTRRGGGITRHLESVSVRQHSRDVKIRARAPFRRGIAERRGDYSSSISDAIRRAFSA